MDTRHNTCFIHYAHPCWKKKQISPSSENKPIGPILMYWNIANLDKKTEHPSESIRPQQDPTMFIE